MIYSSHRTLTDGHVVRHWTQEVMVSKGVIVSNRHSHLGAILRVDEFILAVTTDGPWYQVVTRPEEDWLSLFAIVNVLVREVVDLNTRRLRCL